MDFDWRGWLKTQKVYASRGYTSLVGWIITIGTFAFVVYDDLLGLCPWLISIFPNSFVFVAVALPIVLGILTRLGKWDWKRGTFPKEGATAFQNNPEWVALRKDVTALDEKMNEVLDRFLNRRNV